MSERKIDETHSMDAIIPNDHGWSSAAGEPNMKKTRVSRVGDRERSLLTQGIAEQRAFYRLTDRLYRSRDLAEAYDAVLDAIEDLLGCKKASILRFDASGVMRFVAWRGLSDTYRRGVEGHTPWKQGERDPDPIYVADIDDANESEALKATVRAEGIRSLAFVPLTINRAVVGKFMAYRDKPHDFSDDERGIALSVARQLSFCLERQVADVATGRLVALVESSDDAIIAKSLNGIIQSWNRGAERLFGYSADEAVGKPITMLFPPDRLQEEETILSRIRRGERVNHYETVRKRKDGTLLHVSLTISPIIDAHGEIIGASKIARDFSEQHLARERQQLLLREMNHRVKNLFAVTSSILNLSARRADSPAALVASVIDRLNALARAHALTMAGQEGAHFMHEQTVSLHSLVQSILSPHNEKGIERISVSGDDPLVNGKAVTPIALLLHEFATNAAKYGSLSNPDGLVEIVSVGKNGTLEINWREIGGPAFEANPQQGFGSRLVEATAAQLGGSVERKWAPGGLMITLRLSSSLVSPPN
jgi:PAS domain S-box-containing protein